MMIIDPFEGHFRRMVKRQLDSSIPETLCRVVYKALEFDHDGYLASHRGWNPYGGSLPLAHPHDWETIARYLFQGTNNHFAVLDIDASKVEAITRTPHPLLGLGEFFGDVPRTAIMGMRMYCWNEYETRDRLQHLPHVNKMDFKDRLRKSYGHVPLRVF